MNAATRAAVRYCIRQGHKPFAIHNGFVGLLDDNVHQLSWLGVDNWMTRGGSELGTNRALPSIDLGGVASKFQEYGFNAIMLIGGFEGFTASMYSKLPIFVHCTCFPVTFLIFVIRLHFPLSFPSIWETPLESQRDEKR